MSYHNLEIIKKDLIVKARKVLKSVSLGKKRRDMNSN